MQTTNRYFVSTIFCLLWLAIPLSGQNLDSLKEVLLSDLSTEQRIATLKSLAEGLMNDHPVEAIQYFETLVGLGEQGKDKALAAYAYNRIGSCWLNQNDLKRSIQFYFKALEFTEENSAFDDLKSRIYNNLGWSFKKLNDFAKALQYFTEAEKYGRRVGNKNTVALILNNKGVTQKDLKQLDQALATLNESLSLNREADNKRQERFNLNNISVIYIEQGRFAEAIEVLKYLVTINEDLADSVELTNNFINLGSSYTGLHDYRNAEISFLKSLDYAEQLENAEAKKQVLSELSSIYRQEGKYKESLEYFNKFFLLSDSLKTHATQQFALELESKYTNLIQERELAKAHKELAEQKLYRTWFVGALIIAAFLIVFFWRVIVLKKRNERQLIEINHEMEAQAEELKQANEEILSINENLENIILKRTQVIQNQNDRLRQFAFMNSHKIRGPVASMLGIMQLLADARNTEHSQDLLKHLETCTRNLDEVIHEVNSQLEQDNTLIDGKNSSKE